MALGETMAGREAHGEVTERDERYPEEGLEEGAAPNVGCLDSTAQ